MQTAANDGPATRPTGSDLRLVYGPVEIRRILVASFPALGDALLREAGSFRENRAQIRRDFQAFLAALRADPFEIGEVERLISEQHGRISERQRLGQRLLLERIADMSAAERAAYADDLIRALRRHRVPRR